MQEDKSSFIAEIEVGASYSSLMSATTLFFTGIIISQYKSFSSTIKVPLIYLIISTVSFIFAATIYSNAGNELTLNRIKSVEKYMIFAKNIVELLGLYLFILSVPMVIGAVTKDSFLRTTTIVVALTGFVLYSQSKFSILEKELSRQGKRILSAMMAILALILYFTQGQNTQNSLTVYTCISILLLTIIIVTAISFSFQSKQYKPVIIRHFVDGDEEAISKIIKVNLKESSQAADNGSPKLESRLEGSSPDAIKKLSTKDQIYVAEYDNSVVGMASLSSNIISSIYTDMAHRKKGIGRALVERIEDDAANRQFIAIQAYATQREYGFYKKIGFQEVKEVRKDHNKQEWLMKKSIYANLV